MKIKEIITPLPHYISPDDTLVQAAANMKALDTGWLPICESDCLIGIVTDRDITVRSVAEGDDPKLTTVRQVMSRIVIYCFEDQDIWNAAQIMMTNKIRRLPVLNRNKRLIGIVSLGDLALRGGVENMAARILERVSEPKPQLA